MALKAAYGPAFCAGFSIIPTYMFSEIAKDRFLRCYQDAGLFQTSQLDGWDTSMPTSIEQREEFRRWLVDCHKASFVPICLAGMDNFITAEPSVVVATERDCNEFEEPEISPHDDDDDDEEYWSDMMVGSIGQRGAMFRRLTAGVPKGKSHLRFSV